MDYIALDQLKNSPIEKTMLQTKHGVYVGTILMIFIASHLMLLIENLERNKMNYNKFFVVNFISKWHVMYEILFKYTLKNLAQKRFFFVSILLI